MSQSIKQWWETIVTHYGTLENFEDATTVRIMRDQCRAWVADDIVTVVLLDGFPEALADYDAGMQPHRDEINPIFRACSKWLKSRGLK